MTKTIAYASLCCLLFGCEVAGGEDTAELAEIQSQLGTATLAVDSSPESALIMVIPAANVGQLLPDGYELMVLPGAFNGADGALLWMFSGQQNNVLLDGKPAGTDHLVHTAVQILEPPPPPGQVLTPGAAHLYEVALIFDNFKVAWWGLTKAGDPAIFTSRMHYSQEDPGDQPGFISMTVDPPVGGFSYFAEYGPLGAAPPPVAYTWFQVGDHLSFGTADFANFQASGAAGEVCADSGTWMSWLLGAPCAQGQGLAFTTHATITWTRYLLDD